MILMWLGSFILMILGLVMSQQGLSRSLMRLQRTFLEKGLEAPLAKMFVRALDAVILEGSPQKSLYSGMALVNLRVVGSRAGGLVMCLSTLGAWWAVLLGLLFLSFNGYLLLGIAGLGLLTVFMSDKLKSLLLWVAGTGLFLAGGESMLRHASILQTLLGQSELAFFLADGRFVTVVTFVVGAALLSLLVQIEFWSLALALSLLLTNTIAFNGALGLVAGERLGRMLFFWWQTRGLNQECRRLGWQFSLASAGGVVMGLLVAGELRTFLNLGFSTGLSAYQDKSLQFVMLFAVILAFQWGAQMIWGHFGSEVKMEEVQESLYFGAHWKQWDLLSTGVMSWAREKVQKRHSEIRYHQQGLASLKDGQVSEHIQARLKAEEVQLHRFLHDWL